MLISGYLTTESQRENIFNSASSSKYAQALSCIGKENHRGSRLVHLLLASSLRAGHLPLPVDGGVARATGLADAPGCCLGLVAQGNPPRNSILLAAQ